MDPNSIFQNEFAMVEVRRDESANGVRLLIKDMASGKQVFLDPLELEGLARAPQHIFRSFIASKEVERTADDLRLEDAES